MSARRLIIAIDGPSGAGKGTVARTIAQRLNYRHMDTGAMYRAVAWLAGHDGVDLSGRRRGRGPRCLGRLDVNGRILINGHDVTQAIRTPEIDRAAAIVARHAPVRAVLVERQRGYGQAGGIVMEGRDIGSVVFPQADVKVFLDASPEERARRRAQDDSRATSRKTTATGRSSRRSSPPVTRSTARAPVSPLTRVDDAVYLDTTGVAIDEVVDQVMAIVIGRLPAE